MKMRFALSAPLAAILVACSGCAQMEEWGLVTPKPDAEHEIVLAASKRDMTGLATWLGSEDADVRVQAVRALGRAGGDEAAALAAPLLRDPDPAVRRAAAFAVGASGSARAPALLESSWPDLEGENAVDDSDLLGPAALGLGYCQAPEAEALLISLAGRDPAPVEVPEALFSHYRWRKAEKPTALADPRLLAYADHPDPRGRAGIGWIGRIVKDPALLDALIRTSQDDNPDVRRSAALGLADGTGDAARSGDDAARALVALYPLTEDPDDRVVAASARALASYDQPGVVRFLLPLVDHDAFNVRAAVCGALARRKAAAAMDDLVRLALGDPSVSVRHAAAVALAEIDSVRAQEIVEQLLGDDDEYVRSAAAQVLAKDPGEQATIRLAGIAGSDPHVRVRETAIEGLGGRTGPVVEEAVGDALQNDDPVFVAYACGVVAKNELTALYPALREVPGRFPGTAGIDAREGALSALSEIKDEGDRALVEGLLADPAVAVRWAARQAVAKFDGGDDPDSRDPGGRARWSELPPDVAAVLPRLTPDTTLVVETDVGTMRIRLDTGAAPLHCAHVVALAEKGFYDGLNWHRVVPDFVIQGGCPRGDGSGSAGLALPLEPNPRVYERGTLGMPRSGHPDTGGCQLFICHSRQPHLDVRYTAFGHVVEGLPVIDRVDVDTVIRTVTVEGMR